MFNFAPHKEKFFDLFKESAQNTLAPDTDFSNLRRDRMVSDKDLFAFRLAVGW
jgi:hypothetical protein